MDVPIATAADTKHNHRTHKHNVADKYDYELPLSSHSFGPYETCVGRFKYQTRRCKVCGYEDKKTRRISSIFQ